MFVLKTTGPFVLVEKILGVMYQCSNQSDCVIYISG